MIRYLVLLSSLLIHVTQAQPVPKPSQPWQTLSGERPIVIARGGLSGVFPDSSLLAYSTAINGSLKDSVMFCDLQLTKDSQAFCLSEIRLDNTTNIALVLPKGQKTYNVNGKDVTGWFALDFMADELFPNTTLIQNDLARTEMFDNISPLSLLDDLISIKPSGIWLNVEYDTFYNQHEISLADFILNYPNQTSIQYISSPEIGFLKSINAKIDKTNTKLVFRFLQPDAVEPTTRQPYSAVLKNLGAVKEFASGILVPKEYIVPIGKDMYLQAPTNLVKEAHKLGIEVYAAGFANDMPANYNYSYDPSLEYLQFVDNSQFCVDGVLTDFASTASEAIACIAHNNNATKPKQVKALIISHNGASGDYASCTDLAYEKAVRDGADIIDCSVQMSKDGVAFCSQSPDLMASSTAITAFISKSISVPEIQLQPGVFSFNLAWNDIQTLKPQLTYVVQQSMPRNPAAKNKGKFVTLTNFLDFAKKKGVPGILINIENAAYLASKKGLDITNAVTSALKNATFDKQSGQKVFIRSSESSVLAKFKSFPSYRKVYTVNSKGITSIDEAAVKEIRKVADTINLPKDALIALNGYFTSNDTHIVKKMHDANISVHVYALYNEFTSMPFDMFADPLVNFATFIDGVGVDGVVTDYPATARNYLRSPCRDEKAEYRIQPTLIGNLLSMTDPGSMPPSSQPPPAVIKVDDVVEPPLPSVSNPPADQQKNASTGLIVASMNVYIMSIMVLGVLYGNN